MKIPVNFLPMERFSLDKKNPTGDCERAYRDFRGDFFEKPIEPQVF